MVTWRDLGLERQSIGKEFSPVNVVCPFCGSKGHYNRVYRGESLDANDNVVLTSDVWQCVACANFIFIEWRTEEGFCDHRVFPYEKQKAAAHPSWPEAVGQAYVKAITALLTDDWDMAMMMARHTIGEANKYLEAEGDSLVEELSHLQGRALIPEPMLAWAKRMSQLQGKSNSNADQEPTQARELLRFTRYFLDLLFTLPHDMEIYANKYISISSKE